MSAYTSAICYRSGGDPTIVTGDDLARFLDRLLALDMLDGNPTGVQLKFGRAIDQDDRSTNQMTEITSRLALMDDYDWDIDEFDLSHDQAMSLVKQPPPREQSGGLKEWISLLMNFRKRGTNIYRASFNFGMLKEEIFQPICHELEGNYLNLTDFSFSIDVVELSDPEESTVFEVGWMSFSISGNGYLFPWTYSKALQKLESHPELARIREICREMWPASEKPVPKKLIEGRKKMGKLWPISPEAPHDWYWAIQETY